MKAIINIIYPVGIVCFFYSTEKPDDKFPGTTWEILSTGKYIQTRAQTTATSTGGSTNTGSTTLTVNEMPSHKRTFTGTQATGEFSSESNNGTAVTGLIRKGTSEGTVSGVFQKGTETTYRPNGTSGGAYTVKFSMTPQGSNSNTGGSQGHTHTIEPPYITLSAWRRKS